MIHESNSTLSTRWRSSPLTQLFKGTKVLLLSWCNPPQKNEDLCFLAISLVKILPNPAWQVSTGLRTRKTKFSGSACTSHHDLFHLGFLIHEIKVWNSAQDPLFKKKNYGSIQNQMFVVNSSKFLPLRSLKP